MRANVVSSFKGRIHGSAHVHELKYSFSDFLLILSVQNPTHMYFRDHILYNTPKQNDGCQKFT